MTLVDVMAMVVGVAVGLTVVENQDVYSMTGYLAMLPDRVEVLAERLVGWIWVGSLTMVVVSLGRVVRHRRRPREAEWLAMILAIAYAFGSERIWLPADWLNYRLWHSPENSVDWFGERWAVAALAGLIALGFLGVIRLLRRRLPPWATTVGLCLAMTLIFWGPIHVITLEGASFLVRTQGKVQNFFAWSVADWFVSVPLGLCLGIPIVGAIADLARPEGTDVGRLGVAGRVRGGFPGDCRRVEPTKRSGLVGLVR